MGLKTTHTPTQWGKMMTLQTLGHSGVIPATYIKKKNLKNKEQKAKVLQENRQGT